MLCAETGSKNADLKKYAASRVFTRYEIPNGSYIVLKSGYEYRPEGWTGLTTATAKDKRPAVVKEAITEVNDTWWGSFKFRAFNLSKANAPELKDEEMTELESAMSIFVPIHHDNADDALVKAGYDLSKYKKLDLSMAYETYWNSDYVSNMPTGLTMPDSSKNFPTKLASGNETATKYSATRIFSKAEIPNGSLIVAVKGTRFYADAWVDLDISNSIQGRRPKPIDVTDTDLITVVDDAWWGDFNYRGFDIATSPTRVLTPTEHHQLGEVFAIYTPI